MLYHSLRFNIPKSVLHDSVTNLCKLILQLEDPYIEWPSPEAQEIQVATFNSCAGITLLRFARCVTYPNDSCVTTVYLYDSLEW